MFTSFGSRRVPRRRWSRFVLGVLLGGAGTFTAGSALALGAENEVVSSNPMANQVVDVAPTQLQMVFRDPLPPPANEVRLVLVCNGSPVGLAQPQVGVDLRTVSVALTQIPPAGPCTVTWTLPDGAAGSFSFTSAVSVQTSLPATETTLVDVPIVIGEVVPETPGGGPRVGGLLGLLRILDYLFVSAIFGGFLLVLLAWPEGYEYGVTLRFFRFTWVGALISSWLLVALTTVRESDLGFGAALNPFAWPGALDSLAGYIVLLRFVLIVALVWIVARPERVVDPSTQVPALSLLVVTMATIGLGRLGEDVPLLAHVFGVAHVLSVGAWVGGLAILSRAVLSGPGEADLVAAVRGFSRLTIPLVVIASVTGVMQVYLLDGLNLFASGHGLLSLLKIVVVAVMVWVALLVRAFARTRLAKERELSPAMAWRLRRAVGGQLIVGILVFGVTSWMVPMRPPLTAATRPGPPAAYVFRQELSNEKFSVVVSLTPATTGTNAMRIELLEPARINNFTLRLVPQLPGYEGISIALPLKRRGAVIVPGDGQLVLRAPGVWSIELTGATTTGDLVPLATTVTIGDALTPSTTVPATTTTLVGG